MGIFLVKSCLQDGDIPLASFPKEFDMYMHIAKVMDMSVLQT